MGLFEPHHLIIILVIALLVFGPGKIGDLGGSLGRAVRDFKKSMNEEPSPPAAPQAAPAERRPEALARSQEPGTTVAKAEAETRETA